MRSFSGLFLFKEEDVMSDPYRDPLLDPMRRPAGDPDAVETSRGMIWGGLAFVTLLIVGMLAYSASERTNTASNPPAQTTTGAAPSEAPPAPAAPLQ